MTELEKLISAYAGAVCFATDGVRVSAAFYAIVAHHDARVSELLAANNAEVERRRVAEHSLAVALENNRLLIKLREREARQSERPLVLPEDVWRMVDERRLIEELRAPEASAVVIVNDNPDFGGPNSKVGISADWTAWKEIYFDGENVLDCLRKARAAMIAAKGGPGSRVSEPSPAPADGSPPQ